MRDHQRVATTEHAVTVGAAQLRAVLPLLPQRPLLLLDRHYSRAPWVLATADLAVDQLRRARRDQVLYRPPPPRTGQRGRPTLDGPRFQGADAGADAVLDGSGRHGPQPTGAGPPAGPCGAPPVGGNHAPRDPATGAPGAWPDYPAARHARSGAPTTWKSAWARCRGDRQAGSAPPCDPKRQQNKAGGEETAIETGNPARIVSANGSS